MKQRCILALAGVLSLGLGACASTSLNPVTATLPPSTLAVSAASETSQPSTTLPPPASSTPWPSATPVPLPSPTSTPLPCWSQGGRFEHSSLRDERLKLPLEYSVYLPPCYDQQTSRRYPVLYLIHGQNYNHDQWDRLGADEAADAWVSAGDLPPFLIILPRDRSWSQPTEDPFGQVIVEGLVPYIDEHYRTLPERAFRAVGGLSRGAGWAVHLGLSQWELFGAIGAHSLPVFWTDTYHLREWLDAIPPGSRPRIYMDIGEKDRPPILESAMWFGNLLTEKGIPHEWHLYQGYHEEAYWAAHVEEYLRWYAEEW